MKLEVGPSVNTGQFLQHLYSRSNMRGLNFFRVCLRKSFCTRVKSRKNKISPLVAICEGGTPIAIVRKDEL